MIGVLRRHEQKGTEQALVNRLQELFTAQETRFCRYLAVLDKQQEAIEAGRGEDILCYVELEEKIGAELLSIQKVVLPLEKLYHTAYAAEGNGITSLRSALEARKNEVVLKSKRNRELLVNRMAALRSQIQTIQASPLRRAPVYAIAGIPSVIDIRL
ncbi:MAG: flagellar biosynthesis protein FlgN [Treponema sp.]|jgi:hypothetical protein|nr:flagellar biosynthesis protein FlgN [Treponema sp.]